MPFAVLLTVAGGLANGSFALPMKPMKGWAWERGCFSCALCGLVLMPCAAALLIIPNLGQVYAATSPGSYMLVVLFWWSCSVSCSEIWITMGVSILIAGVAVIGFSSGLS